MPRITFEGVFSRSGIGGDPVVFIDAKDHTRFNQWWSTHNIFTQIFSHPHPATGVSCPIVYISQRMAQPFQNGDPVKITIDVRPEKRGNGIKTLSVV
jgi:hypothetical protein